MISAARRPYLFNHPYDFNKSGACVEAGAACVDTLILVRDPHE
jgi:hypothetical protein